MSFKFNPFTGKFDIVGSGGGSTPPPVTLLVNQFMRSLVLSGESNFTINSGAAVRVASGTDQVNTIIGSASVYADGGLVVFGNMRITNG